MRAALKWTRRALELVGFFVLASTLTPLPFWYATWLAGDWSEAREGILIVPGAEWEEPNLMGPGTYRRAQYAKLAWDEGKFRGILVLGQGVAPTMSDWLSSHGIPKDSVLTENLSRSTRENAIEAAKILKNEQGPFVLLTSDYHAYRCSRTFLRAGLGVTTRPIPDVRKRWQHWPSRWAAAADLGVESAKIAWYQIKGWM